jgi:tetratricopeptide (TPR) repeat protein
MVISRAKVNFRTSRVPLILLSFAVVLGLSCRRQQADTPAAVDSGDEAGAAQKIAEADQLYVQREDISKVRQGIALLRQARIADYGNHESAWKLAKFSYYLGAHTTDEREREDAFREGIETGKIAVQLQGDKPEGHFWLAANYGGDAEHSTLAGLANVEDIRQEMEVVLKLDEGYEGGSAYVGMGELYLEAPRALGGDNSKAIEYLEKGLRVASDNAVIRLNLAKAYHAAKRDDDARKQIDYILKMTPNPNYLPEYKETVEKAKKLSEEIDRQ